MSQCLQLGGRIASDGYVKLVEVFISPRRSGDLRKVVFVVLHANLSAEEPWHPHKPPSRTNVGIERKTEHGYLEKEDHEQVRPLHDVVHTCTRWVRCPELRGGVWEPDWTYRARQLVTRVMHMDLRERCWGPDAANRRSPSD